MKTILLVIAALTLTGCDPSSTVAVEGNRTIIKPEGHMALLIKLERIDYDGHTYIVNTANRAGGITHDPDCHCTKLF